jgi:phosphopantetheinyl transferase
MGKIISSKQLKNNKFLIKILTENQDLKNLKGNLKNIHIFTDECCTKEACVKERGNNKTTKYFQIPLTLRPKKRSYQKLISQKIESQKAIYYIYGLIS